MKIAYWDTAQGNPPALIGQIRGTPTIKLLYPSKKNKKRSNRDKVIVDYQQAREVGPMKEFAISRMPSFVERLKKTEDVDKFLEKANKYNLPKVILFAKKGPLKSIYRALSTSYRRRVLVGYVTASATDADAIRERFEVKRFPALIAVGAGENGEVVDKYVHQHGTADVLKLAIGDHCPQTGSHACLMASLFVSGTRRKRRGMP